MTELAGDDRVVHDAEIDTAQWRCWSYVISWHEYYLSEKSTWGDIVVGAAEAHTALGISWSYVIY